MALIKINGSTLASLGGYLEKPTLSFSKQLRETPNDANFDVYGYKPSVGSEVEVYNSAGSTLLFAGLLLRVEQIQVGRGGSSPMRYRCQLGGWEHLLQRTRLQYRFPVQTAGAAVRQMIAMCAPEIDVTGVQDGPDLPSFAWSDYPLLLLERLAEYTGFYWAIAPDKSLTFAAQGTTLTDDDLTDTSYNFSELTIETEGGQVRNAVTVRGGYYASSSTVTDYFDGTGTRDKFKLSYTPFSSDRNPLFRDTFSPSSDYHPDDNLWTETDTSNGSPPSQPDSGKAPFTGTDGYIIQDNFRGRDAIQFVGGPGTWTIGILGTEGFDREDDRYFYATIYAHVAGDLIIGFFDGVGIADTDCLHGVRFEAASNGIHIQESGAKVTLSGPSRSYAVDTTYSIRITLKSAGGALYEIIGGAYGTWEGKTWTTLRDGSSGTDAILYPGIAGKSLDASVYEVKVGDPVLGMTVTVYSVDQVVGIDNVDSVQVDCLINAENQLLRFFTDNKPASGTDNIVVTYRRPVPILVEATDGPSIAALAALTGETGESAGRREYYLRDETITSLEEGRRRAEAEVAIYGNPIVTAKWSTVTDGYEPGQVININLTNRGESRDFLITEVSWRHLIDDNYIYQITAGSRLKSLEDYISGLIQERKRLPFDTDTALEILVSTSESVEISESEDELDLGPTAPFVYDTAEYARGTYA